MKAGFETSVSSSSFTMAGVCGSRFQASTIGAVGREGEILAKVIVHSLILTALMGVVAMLQAYVVPWMVPKL